MLMQIEKTYYSNNKISSITYYKGLYLIVIIDNIGNRYSEIWIKFYFVSCQIQLFSLIK